MYGSEIHDDNNCGSTVDSDIETWFCPECLEFRDVDGQAGFACDSPRECPSDSFGDDNCGFVVCGECHSPLSDRHLAPNLLGDN
jgi:hypothetical protein